MIRKFLNWLAENMRVQYEPDPKRIPQNVRRRWQEAVESGYCRCGGRVYLAQSTVPGRQLTACENQYNGEQLGLLGTGQCTLSLADVELMRQSFEYHKEPFPEIS